MSAPTTIRSFHISELTIPLSAPLTIGAHIQTELQNLLLTLELADGTRGYGEVAIPFSHDGATRAQLLTQLNGLRSKVEGGDIHEWRLIAEQLRAVRSTPGPLRCAIETALLDALTRRAQIPLWAFFGGGSNQLESSSTITNHSVEHVTVAALEAVNAGFTSIKLRLSGKVEHDLACIVAVHQVVPQQPLILDSNGTMTAEQVLELLAILHMQAVRPVLLEQPVPTDDWQSLEQLAAWGGVPVATDESINGIADVLRLVYERRAQVVTIKLAKTGVVESLDMVAICRAAGLGLMISSTLETPIGIGMAACFAAGLGNFRFVELDMPYRTTDLPLHMSYSYTGGRFDLRTIQAGHGVVPT